MTDAQLRDAAVAELKLTTKTCSCCRETKGLSEFPRNKATQSGIHCYCRKCSTAKRKVYYLANREQVLARQVPRGKMYRDKLRAAALSAYGDACACCGETIPQFLAIDHIGGGGGQHRRIVGTGQQFYRWLKEHGYPVGFRVLCHNCNQAVGLYGECPHDRVRIGAA